MWTDYVNVVLVIALISWCAAQVIKTILYSIKYKFNPERIFGAGGMPSSHSATVCALAIATARVEGVTSTEFALAMVLAMVVMYDATGVRAAAGKHAKQINQLKRIVNDLDEELLDDLDERIQDEDESHPGEMEDLKEYLGHTPLEVLCGALLGILIAMAFPISA